MNDSTYILTLTDHPEGVFSLIDRMSGDQIIPIFENQDDAERYALQLIDDEAGPELQLVEIEKELIIAACEQRNHRYAIITVDDFIIPPIDLE
ncbi:hypothetical protein T040910_151 [Synechococcus phage S-CAM3]|uniref:DUF3110 domain-containing protein n=1 Tax=Synechococcus phage S-CAM3 TaxID=1883366 RepID=A0A1D8KJ15_9CAUD|nr:hypothetical protein BOW87_gp107 [Synechococcus phage S-CAM3]AOV58655.1 hypothetical protein S250808_150 [Synechococcus phage S-CAM3]AOV58895.1 hypothetical protein T040910_151 [Synechococcus phage S-CAM3]AOV59134.1 hypothetical protein C421010_151 [Synechococcus phage S-CAM3]